MMPGRNRPWITGQIMPDVFSPVVLLSLFLLAFCTDQLTRGESMYVGALLTVGITTHLSHVRATLRTYPVEILQTAIINAGHQLLQFGTGEGLSPEFTRLVAPHIGEVFGPDVEKSLLQSKQAEGGLPIAEFRQLHFVGLLLSLAVVLRSLIVQRMSATLVALYVFIPAGIVWNAVVTGALSGPFYCYMARVYWVICFVALVGFSCVAPLRAGARHRSVPPK
jgi:hypothetical protein